MLDYKLAQLQGDLLEANCTIQRVADLTPDSAWTLYLAGEALGVHLHSEAVSPLCRFDPAQLGEADALRY